MITNELSYLRDILFPVLSNPKLKSFAGDTNFGAGRS